MVPVEPVTMGNWNPPHYSFDIVSWSADLNMWLIDGQHVCIKILGTNIKRYRLWPSGIPAPKTWSQDDFADFLPCWLSTMEPGRREARMTNPGWCILCLIGMDCAGVHVETFAPPSLDLFVLVPSPSIWKSLPALILGNGFCDMSPPSSRR